MPTETLPCGVFNSTFAFESNWFLFKWFESIPFSSSKFLSVSRPSTLEGGTITNLPSETNSSSKSDSSDDDTSRSSWYSSALMIFKRFFWQPYQSLKIILVHNKNFEVWNLKN